MSVRQAIQDRHVMHATLQTYLKHLEANAVIINFYHHPIQVEANCYPALGSISK